MIISLFFEPKKDLTAWEWTTIFHKFLTFEHITINTKKRRHQNALRRWELLPQECKRHYRIMGDGGMK